MQGQLRSVEAVRPWTVNINTSPIKFEATAIASEGAIGEGR